MAELGTNDDMMNFSGSAADMMAAMKAAGISDESTADAAASALKVAASEASHHDCTDPTHDHSHRHDHGEQRSSELRNSEPHDVEQSSRLDQDDSGDDEGDEHDSDEAEKKETAPAADEQYANALRENIAKKGKNAYYYAHAHNADAPKWDGSEAPRLLEKKAPDSAPVLPVSKISKFAWSDEQSKVKVYVNLADNGIKTPVGPPEVSFTATSVALRISAGDVVHLLDLPSLNDTIAEATAKLLKGERVVLTLTKPQDSAFTWHDLKKSA